MNPNGTDSQECEYELALQKEILQKEIDRLLAHLAKIKQHDRAELARQQAVAWQQNAAYQQWLASQQNRGHFDLPLGDALTGHEIERQRLELELLLLAKASRKPQHSLMDDLKAWKAEFGISDSAFNSLIDCVWAHLKEYSK